MIMIPMWQIDGEWQQIRGNPIVTSLDRRYRAPLRTILSPAWTQAERLAYGIYELEPAEIPEGFTSVKRNFRLDPDNIIREEHFLERIPEPETPPTETNRLGDGNRPRRSGGRGRFSSEG